MVTSTTITARGTISSPTYTARGTISSPAFTARGTVTNPYYQGSTETETDQTAPVISNFHANVVSLTYVVFDWDTDEPATCHIKYGTDPLVGTGTVVSHDHLIMTNRNITASGLARGKTYYVRARSTDAYDNTGATGVYVFTTANTDDAGGAPIPT